MLFQFQLGAIGRFANCAGENGGSGVSIPAWCDWESEEKKA